MKISYDVSQLSNDELLVDLSQILIQSHDATAKLIAHLAEVDSRKLYLAKACSSLFSYCVQNLHFSEGGAYRRIQAARTARRFPIIFNMVADGELHLTAITLLAKHLTDENHRALLLQVPSSPAHLPQEEKRQRLYNRSAKRGIESNSWVTTLFGRN